MIDKNFYLENLSAFDILIQDEDRTEAEKVIFRVFSILQRDKIWLREVATEEEIYEEDVELLEEVEEELKELDEQYDFKFDEFYKLVQQEMKKIQSTSNLNLAQHDNLDKEDYHLEEEDQNDLRDDDEFYDEDFDINEDIDDEDQDDEDEFSHLSDDELALVEDFILASAKTRFNYSKFLEDFAEAEEGFVDEEILLPIIAGKAFGEPDTEIAQKMQSSFMMFGYQMEMGDLIKMIELKGKELGPEILAFKIAADSLQQGAHPTAIIPQISPLLRG